MKRLLLILALASLACSLQTPAPVPVAPLVTQTLAPVPVPTPTPAGSCLVVTASKALNLRSGPALSFPVSAWLVTGKQVTLLASVGDWLQVDTDNKIGYVHASYVRKCDVQTRSKAGRR